MSGIGEQLAKPISSAVKKDAKIIAIHSAHPANLILVSVFDQNRLKDRSVLCRQLIHQSANGLARFLHQKFRFAIARSVSGSGVFSPNWAVFPARRPYSSRTLLQTEFTKAPRREGSCKPEPARKDRITRRNTS